MGNLLKKTISLIFMLFILFSCTPGKEKNRAQENKQNQISKKVHYQEYSYPDKVQYMDVNGIRLAYVEKGQGQPILFLHGVGVDLSMWNYIFPLLKNQYRLIALDLPGHGLSEKPENASYRPNFYGKVVSSFIKTMNLKSVYLAGLSMGGLIAFKVYQNSPEKIKKIIFIDSAGMLSFNKQLQKLISKRYTVENFMNRKDEDIPKHLSPFLYKKTESIFQHIISMVLKQKKFDDYRQYAIAQVKSWQGMTTKESYIANDLKMIKIPALIIWGKQDGPLPVYIGHQMHKKIPNSTLKIIDQCGHVSPMEQPGKVAKAILNFLKDNS